MSLSVLLATIKNKYPIRFSSTGFALTLAAIFLLFYNASFYSHIALFSEGVSLRGVLFLVNASLVLWLLTFIVISLMTLPWIAKPLLGFILFAAAGVAYFMDSYGVVIHRLMVQNMAETDVAEVRGLLSGTLFCYLFFLGVVPVFLLNFITINFQSFRVEVFRKVKNILIAFIICVALIFAMTSDYASFFRNQKSVRQMANPLNFIYASLSYLTASNKVVEIKPIEHDAKLNELGMVQTKPTLLILVVGETARADHFGINGYGRDTTPLLKNQDIINFTNVSSCGTETSVSVPCMFSNLGRDKYSDKKAKSQQGLLDVISHAGMSVLWRDNNSSCKGACDRVTYEEVQHLDVPELCNDRECFDEILLHQLDEKVQEMQGNKVIVLHQKGSHGPDYFNRYPESSKYFSPVCDTNRLQDCTQEQVINGFDNTIRYTDLFLNSAIEWLKARDKYNTSLVYLSDHGESLGESHMYLHGMPYAIAPKEQKRVPMLLWLSESFAADNKIDSECLKTLSSNEYSHDNLFHTVLGMLNISSSVYSDALDITKPCRSL